MGWCRTAFVLAGVVCLAVSGCGDDAGPSSATTGSGSGESTSIGGTTVLEGSATMPGTVDSGSAESSATVAVDDTAGSSGSSSGGAGGECGDGMLEGDEVCDGVELAGQTCASQGFDGGTLGCAGDCGSFDDSGCWFEECGDDRISGKEQCDGRDLGEATCVSLGFDGGTLGCDARCLHDTAGCGTCGNVIVDGDEACDDIALLGETCESQGFDSGQLACQGDCLGYETSGCGICGNSLIDGAEACDDGNLIDGDACANDCEGTHRIVFVSSVMFDGNMGGLLGADAECQALAEAAGLPGTFMAWLSTAAESPATRMTQSTGRYVRVDGVEVAPDWAGLVDGSLSAPINVTENGGAAPVGNSGCGGGGLPSVWTATDPDGTSGGSVCGGWTSTVGTSQWGLADATNSTWSYWCVGGVCNTVSPIYCVQQ